VEALPSVRELFFIDEPVLSQTPEEVNERLYEVKAALRASSTSSNLYVRSTAYYIGNLLILPNLTLHALLSSGDYPRSGQLLDTALADVRAGAIKLQRYFDIAPPSFYDAAVPSQLTYRTASFPSLTVTEVATVLQLLSIIDPDHARLYEEQLQAYLSDVLASGSHWPQDITYGVSLANAMVQSMQSAREYQTMIAAARSEWAIAPADFTYEWRSVPYRMVTNPFRYANQFTISQARSEALLSTETVESFQGTIQLSLQDERLPQPVPRVYAYDLAQDSLLPYYLDLTAKQYPGLGHGVSHVRATDDRQAFFLSGTPAPVYEPVRWYRQNKLFYRSAGFVRSVELTQNDMANYTALEWRPSAQQLLVVDTAQTPPAEGDIWRITLADSAVTATERVGVGASATMLDDERVLYVTGGMIYEWAKDAEAPRLRSEIPAPDSTTVQRTIHFSPQSALLTVHDTQLQPETLIHESQLHFYRYDAATRTLAATVTLVVTDAEVLDSALSPGGSHVALLVTLPGVSATPKLLLYDINSGIIKKELLLSGFSPKRLAIDEWLARSDI
jgi:hypothetical protein